MTTICDKQVRGYRVPPLRPRAVYTDGTPVQVGDYVRYHQAAGGVLAPPTVGGSPWNYGVVVAAPWPAHGGAVPWWYAGVGLAVQAGPYAGSTCVGLVGHVVERVPTGCPPLVGG